MNTTTEHSPKKQISFNNNPFSLAFAAMGQAFKINQNPAIVIIVGGIVLWIADQILSNIPDIANTLFENSDESIKTTVAVSGLVFLLAYMLVAVFVQTVWNNFKAYVGLVNARSEQTSVGAGFKAGLSKFWSALGMNLLIGLISGLFLLPAIVVLCVGLIVQFSADQEGVAIGLYIASGIAALVGMFFSIRYTMARTLSVYALFDENLGVFGAMSRSVALTKGRLIEVWGMAFPGAIIPVVGSVLMSCGLGAHYLQLKVYRDHNVELPKVHILSWLPLILIALLFFGIFALGAFVGLLASMQ